MPWFKVDDNLAFHHKAIAAGNPALGLWVRAGSMCAQQLTDGFVPDHMVMILGTKAQAERLVSVGLWDRAKGGYNFHEWAERQPSKADVEAERAAAKERMRAYRAKKKGVSLKPPSQVSDSCSPEQTENFGDGSGEVLDAFGNPDPSLSRPDPSNTDASGDFDDFWTIYPRKEGKGAAKKAWAKAVKILPASELLPIVRSYSVRVHGTEKRFIPFPATWLNQERWADEVDEQQAEASGDDGWFQPFTMPPAPREVEDDPEAYEAWAEGRRQAWRNGERW
jgi:hypothetical protein